MKEQKSEKKHGRRAYLDQFRRDASGQYVYTGGYYIYSDPKRSRRSTLVRLWIPALLLAADVIAQGCLPADGIRNCIYVLLPFLGEIFVAGSLIRALIGLSVSAEPLREYIYRESAEPLCRRALISMILTGLVLIGEGICLLINGIHTPKETAAFQLLTAAALVPAQLLRRRTRKLPWIRQEENAGSPASLPRTEDENRPLS